MKPSRSRYSRRSTLVGSATGLAALAGCTSDLFGSSETTDGRPSGDRDEPSDAPRKRDDDWYGIAERYDYRDTAPAWIAPSDATPTSVYELPQYRGIEHTLESPPETEAIAVSIDETGVTVEADLAVVRPLDITLHLFETDSDGRYEPRRDTERLLIETLEPNIEITEDDDVDADDLTYESTTITFDLPEDFDAPLHLVGDVVVTVADTDSPEVLLLTHHEYQPLPYSLSNDDGILYLDGDEYDLRQDQNNIRYATYDLIEYDTEYLGIFTVPYMRPGDLPFQIVRFGGTYTIPKHELDDYQRQLSDSRDIYDHADVKNYMVFNGLGLSRVHNVEDYSYIGDFAHTLWDATTAAGIIDQYHRLDAIAYTINAMGYSEGEVQARNAPTGTLFEQTGNCTEWTFLYNAILRCAPFNIRTAYMTTYVRDYAHEVSLIDARDLDLETLTNIDESSMFESERPDIAEELPDTEYVWVDVTNSMDDSFVGNYSSSLYHSSYITTTSDLHRYAGLNGYPDTYELPASNTR
ncbi:transglutaminase domain-containing protein [Natrononativus amylolyticus]|uniref:transglutaminase domain-containing protein n=1 Tax=Natrononativus amylolyticus TaxID=2963434 RepID=UPI0020CFBA68|nr:transglutaminase domain-containing protein [Natrononativus amylolyticus]